MLQVLPSCKIPVLRQAELDQANREKRAPPHSIGLVASHSNERAELRVTQSTLFVVKWSNTQRDLRLPADHRRGSQMSPRPVQWNAIQVRSFFTNLPILKQSEPLARVAGHWVCDSNPRIIALKLP